MIDLFESTTRIHPGRVFLAFVGARGDELSYTYRQARIVSAAIARKLHAAGVRKGDTVAVDLPNSPEFVFLLLAAAYGSFSLATLNHRLAKAEKAARLAELKAAGVRVACTIDEQNAEQLIGRMRSVSRSDAAIAAGVYGEMRRDRAVMGARQDIVEDTVHFAERAAHLFDDETRAVIMFTSGTTGRPKAVSLTWRRLVAAAQVANGVLSRRGEGLWQAVLPLYHIGGLQVVVRSIANCTPVRLHERFDAADVLRDAEQHRVTHVSVVDKMLRDMLAADAQRTAAYRCILLGGGATNPQTADACCRVGARVFASYGMTETSSQIANSPVDARFAGELRLMPGYAARIVDPDAEGFGRLAVRGPGVFDGYLNARAAFTVDGFFLTGDTAALNGDMLRIRERTADMFVSGGENIYPAEIALALRRVPGVADAHVFAVPDPVWGRRPAAVVERSEPGVTADKVRRALAGTVSKLNMPEGLLVVDELPRGGIGKIDRLAVERLFEQRIELRKIVLHHVRIPFRTPFKTAQVTLEDRSLIIVEAVDHAGRVGLGECVAFDTSWYLPETLGEDARFMTGELAPRLVGRSFSHPREVSELLAAVPGAAALPMAQSALEMACWDLYGHIRKAPLWELLNEERRRLRKTGLGVGTGELPRIASVRDARALVPAGAVVGVGSPGETVEAVGAAVAEGYRRVKLKVAPGSCLASVRAVREAFPALLITLDANMSFAECDMDELRQIDGVDAGWIEEPLVRKRGSMVRPRVGHVGGAAVGRNLSSSNPLERLSYLQRMLSTPVCVDESFSNAEEAQGIFEFRNLRCVAVKIGKFGGIEPALRFVLQAQGAGVEIWMGGMYDTGISKRVHAAFETLPGVIVPGDVGATSRYFDIDVTDPPHTVRNGHVMLNSHGHDSGIGCGLDREALARVLVGSVSVPSA